VPEAWRFLKKVWKFWQINLTGSVFIAILVLVQIFVRSVPWWAYAGIAAMTLIMSCFLAWRDEYRSRLALENSRGEEWLDLLGQAKAELSFRLETEQELEVTKRQLEEAKQRLTDEKANKLTIDEIVLRESSEGFRNLVKTRHNSFPPRQVLNESWIRQVAAKYGRTEKDVNESIDRLDGARRFHWQA
jgi:hypothetical protein